MAGPADIQNNFGPITIVGKDCTLMPDPRELRLGTCFVEEVSGAAHFVVRVVTPGPTFGHHIWMPPCI